MHIDVDVLDPVEAPANAYVAPKAEPVGRLSDVTLKPGSRPDGANGSIGNNGNSGPTPISLGPSWPSMATIFLIAPVARLAVTACAAVTRPGYHVVS